MPDRRISRPDLSRPDLSRPDLSRPDLARPNLARRQFTALGASAIIASAVLAPAAARAQSVLRIGDQKGGSKALMSAAGVLDGFEDRVAWNTFAAAAPLLEALNAGAIDAGGVGDAPFAFARAAGVKAKIVVGTRSSGANTAMVVAGSSHAQSIADLKGRTIATGKGSVGHYLVIAACKRAGLQTSDVKLAFLSPADAQSAFVSGAVDAWSTWGPYVWLMTTHNKARVLVDGQGGLMSGLSYYVASESAIATKRDVLTEYNKRLVTALRWGLANRDAYAAAWAKETGVPVDVAQLTLKAQSFAPAPIDAQMIADQQHTVDLYAQEGLLPARYDAAAGFDTSFNV
jgi:sulfonate transport system substrate-binding protein